MQTISFYRFRIALFALFSIAAFIACEEEIVDPEPKETNKTSGFVVVGTTASETALVKYFETLPTGTIDLSDGKDFQQFFPTTSHNSAIFLRRTDGASGFAKMVVNDKGEVVEDGIIPTVDNSSFRIAVRDAETGVFQDRATPDVISVFNPTTLEVTGSIDMSAGFVPGDVAQRYQRFIFRGDDLFAPIRANDGATFNSFILHQANLSNNSYVGHTIAREEIGSVITTNNFGQGLVDAAGNLYVQDAGNFDGLGIAARVNKVPAGSNAFDTSYVFQPAVILNPLNAFLPTFNTFKLVDEARALAIAKVNANVPQEAVDIVIGAGGTQNLTPDQIQQIFGILFSAETAVWCELDLNAQTVTPIGGIPAQGVFTAGNTFEHNGEIYLPVVTASENAFYKYTPGTSQGQKAFDVTGADIQGMYNLGIDN